MAEIMCISHSNYSAPHSQPLRGLLMWRGRGASRLVRPGKENRFWSERKRPDLQDGLFPGVLNSYISF